MALPDLLTSAARQARWHRLPRTALPGRVPGTHAAGSQLGAGPATGIATPRQRCRGCPRVPLSAARSTQDDPLIDLIENDRGLAGDLYQLRIPDEIADRASRVAWRPGKLHALRPVFRELGHPAAFVYEALEQAKGAQRSFDLVTVTGLSRTAVYEALETLAAWHLVVPVDGRWKLVPGTSLQLLAEQFGCLEQVRSQVGRHRGERAAYRRALRIVDHHHPEATTVLGLVEEAEAYLWPPEPPPEDGETLMDLLHRELGAYRISG